MGMRERLVRARELGWSMIPVKLDKRPAIPSWREYQERVPTTEELRSWASMKPPAWAIVTGHISGVCVIDFDGEQGRRTMVELGLEPHVRTGSGGYHVYVTHPGWPIKTVNARSKQELGLRYPGTDIRADGGYAVFAGRNAAGEYEWLRDMTPDCYSVLPQPLRKLFGFEPDGDEPDEPAPPGEAPTAIGDPVPLKTLVDRAMAMVGQGRANAVFWLACQLRDNGYNQGMAQNCLRDLVGRFPPTNTKGDYEPYTVGEALATLRSAYSQPPRQPWRPREALPPTPKAKRPEPKPFLDLIPERGFLAAYTDYARELTDAPPEFHLAVGLAMVSAALSNNVWFMAWGQQTFCNLWTLLLAPSGIYRKSTAMKIGLELLGRAVPDAILAGDFTRERLVDNLAIKPAGVIPVWEFGSLLTMLGRDYNLGLKQMLTELYDAPFYRRETKGGRQDIDRPALSIMAASTIDWIVDRISDGDLRSGWLCRFLFWPATAKAEWKGLAVHRDAALADSLVAFLGDIALLHGEATFDDALRGRYNEWLRGHEEAVNDNKLPHEVLGFFTRLATYVLKFAVIYQASIDLSTEITAEALEYGIRTAERLKAEIVDLVRNELQTGRDARELKGLERIIRRCPGIERRELLQRCHMRTRLFRELIETLKQSGVVIERAQKVGSGVRLTYYAALDYEVEAEGLPG